MHVPYLRVSDIGPVGPGGGRAAGAAAAPPRCAKRSAKPHMVQNLRNSPRNRALPRSTRSAQNQFSAAQNR